MASATPLAQICKSLTPGVFSSLRQKGYAVVDGAVGQVWKQQLRDDIDHLKETSRLHLNSTHLVTDGGATTQFLEKSNVWEAELADPSVHSGCRGLELVQGDLSLVKRLNDLGFGNTGRHRLAHQTVKVQFNGGDGGCFPYHFDTDPALDSRRLTAILYLNEQWDAEAGGQLQLAPWPRRTVSIDPSGDRLVIFSSADMVHRVLPSKMPRYCLTMWLWASSITGRRHPQRQRSWLGAEPRDKDFDSLRRYVAKHSTVATPLWQATKSEQISPDNVVSALQLLMAPTYRRHTVRWALAHEWADSICESHPQGSGFC
eukprot:INCI3703.2.p1 GENE.INCI3703.2~~INCI3703.2.p1  ORF type:complete len:315 (-),score=28.86 INCI3703.2:377-1321(-)